jgi:hypothetical protein
VPNPQWFPGDQAAGSKVNSAPQIFTQVATFQKAPVLQAGETVTGVATFQSGQVNSAPQPVVPGTVASLGTVSNTLGYDVVVYASATTGIQAAKVGTVSIPGSSIAGQTTTYVVPSGLGITLTYSGTLSWTWLAK